MFGTPYNWVYANGEFVQAEDARVGVLANALSYGTGTFEGIRATWNPDREQLYLLEADGHYRRMRKSAHILGLELPEPPEVLTAKTAELLRRNDVRHDAYVRPLLLLGEQQLFVRMDGIEQWFCIAATPIPGDYINTSGVRCLISSWRRTPDDTMPNRAKVIGGYVGPALAKTEAVRRGFDEAIMLNTAGRVAEATTSNIVIRRGNEWATPPSSEDILEGITLRQVRSLLAQTNIRVSERPIQRSELLVSDEVFLTGTAASVVPVVEVDGRTIGDGKPGETTLELQQQMRAIARGDDVGRAGWLTQVYS